MKKFIVSFLVLFISQWAIAQQIGRVLFTKNGQLESIEMELPETVVLKLSKDGQISQWGANRYAGRDEILREKLDPYVGRVEYYRENDNEAFRGKIRSIGTIAITYYASFDNPAFAGKIKSIGSLQFDYYTLQDNEAFKGNIKRIGNADIAWYSTFDLDDLKGKLKSIGNTSITYYSSLDDTFIHGKVKSIGGSTYQYYTSFDRKELRGLLKTGQPVRTVNGIKYLVRF